ncbi:putative hydroxymethylpyrimidine transporter CytX [Desulfovibrio aminophilus]|nr:putative hydroxymethylpyrimidine transporter CytX [Desulfovibrio aminophilus]
MDGSKSLSFLGLFALWFGAAVSVAEILTGGLLADIGLERGLWAVALGHLAGMLPFALAAWAGFRERLPAIACTRVSFGARGSWIVSLLNVLQLVGWTAVMIQQGGLAVNALTTSIWGLSAPILAPVLLGGLVGLWVCLRQSGLHILNLAAVGLLFCLTVALSVVVFGSAPSSAPAAPVGSFGLGFELSIIMPLSWLPLVADYTSQARSRPAAWLAPCLGYFLGSCWMYAIGLLGALRTGSADPSGMMLAAGLGGVALAVIILATVTTTFLDVYSAAVSLRNILPGLNRRAVSGVVALLGTALAVLAPSDAYIDFLYLLGSVFAPVAAVFLTDYFLARADSRGRVADPLALASLAAGVLIYQLLSGRDLPIGPTLATMLLTATLHLALRTAERGLRKDRDNGQAVTRGAA